MTKNRKWRSAIGVASSSVVLRRCNTRNQCHKLASRRSKLARFTLAARVFFPFFPFSYHVRLSHLALQVGSSNWVHKTQIHSIQRWRHFGAKTSWSTVLLEGQLHPSLYWIPYSWSGSTIILYYINLSVRWNTLLRNQISLCQYSFNTLSTTACIQTRDLRIMSRVFYHCATLTKPSLFNFFSLPVPVTGLKPFILGLRAESSTTGLHL